MSEEPVLAVDIGGTKLAAALGFAGGRLAAVTEVATPPGASGEALFGELVGLLEQVLDGRWVARIGVGCGGPMRWEQGVVSPLNIPGWREFPLSARLTEHFAGAEVRLHNDAVAVAVGEHWAGAGRGARALLGVVVSTGVGAGLVLDGRVLAGPTGNAGHLGHVVVDPRGPACECGGQGCAEAVARGPALAQWAVDRGWLGAARADAVAAGASAGDPVAVAALHRSGAAVGVALSSAAALLDLDRVVVGGGVAGAGDSFFGPLRAAFHRHARISFARRCQVLPAALGRQAGLVGAAGLWLGGPGYWPGAAGHLPE